MRFILLAALLPPLSPQDDLKIFTCKEGNYRVGYPRQFRKIQSVEETFQLTVSNDNNVIMVSGLEAPSTSESLATAIEQHWKLMEDESTAFTRKEIRVAEERAILLTAHLKKDGVRFIGHAVFFAHQGIAYQIIGVCPPGEARDFQADFEAVTDSIEFLGDRKEWIDKFEGKPARTALLGGLAGFELKRPRWTETTFDDDAPTYNLIDHARFDFLGGDAWITFEARNTTGTGVSELDALRHDLSSRLQKPVVHSTDIVKGAKTIQYTEIIGEHDDTKYRFRAAVAVREGISLRVYLECQDEQSGVTAKDWESLLHSLSLQSLAKPDEPPAWMADRACGRGLPDPTLAKILAGARRVAPNGTSLLATTSNGRRALVRENSGLFLLTLETEIRERVETPDFDDESAVALSSDGRRVAVASGSEIRVTGDMKTVTIPVHALHLAFTVGGDALLAVVPISKTAIGTSRLERVGLDGARKILCDFPLSRIDAVAPSPDGKRLAIVCNRDYPRTAMLGGHLYVADADGTNLRQLTKEPEAITTISWSVDGRSILAVRRLSVGDDGAVGTHGPVDLWRISAETGEAANLTRSGHPMNALPAGDDLLLELSTWRLTETQKGIFRLSVESLEKATATLSVPPVWNAREARKAIAQKLVAAVGPVAEVVPTPEILAKAAKAFAASAGPAMGRPFDFSAASLENLWMTASQLALPSSSEPALTLGLGAYYGETLRHVAGAEWRISPLPFGRWLPGDTPPGNPLVLAVLPFSTSFFAGSFPEEVTWIYLGRLASQDQGKRLILVYPPASVEGTVREATDRDYLAARRLLDSGDVKSALDLLAKELQRFPKNRDLAVEVTSLCERAVMPDAAKALARKAVEGGNLVPDLLMSVGDEKLADDPKAALEFYRKAAQGDRPPAAALVKLGHAYAALGNRPVAESCWRRAHSRAPENERPEIRKLMGMKPKAGEE